EDARALGLFEDALSLARMAGDSLRIMSCLKDVAWRAFADGDNGRAKALLDELRTLLDDRDDPNLRRMMLGIRAEVARSEGELGNRVGARPGAERRCRARTRAFFDWRRSVTRATRGP